MPGRYVLYTVTGRAYPVEGSLLIGRDPSCQLVFTDDPLISRKHATVWEQSGGLYIRDENSSNGSYVDRHRIPAGQPVLIRPGQRVMIGQVMLTVALAEAASGAAPASHPGFRPFPTPPTAPVQRLYGSGQADPSTPQSYPSPASGPVSAPQRAEQPATPKILVWVVVAAALLILVACLFFLVLFLGRFIS